MATKKVTGGFVTVSKTGRVGSKVFKTKAGAEKVQRTARKNLAKTRGGKAAAKPKGKGSSNPATAGTTAVATTGGSAKTGMGKAFLNAQTGLELLAPVGEGLLRTWLSLKGDLSDVVLKDIPEKVLTTAYAFNVAIASGDRWLDKKLGQAAALSRGSVTAWGPEVYAGALAIEAGIRNRGSMQSNVAAAHRTYIAVMNGYDVRTSSITIGPATVTYRTAKHAGQLLRKMRGRSKLVHGLTEPIREFVLKPIGLTI